MKRSKTILGTKSTYRGILVIFLLLCILSGVFSFQYYARLQKTIREESSDYLLEIAQRVGSNINRIIDDNYAVLNTMASTLKSYGALTFADFDQMVSAQQEYWNYRHILLVDNTGKAYTTGGKELPLSNSDFFQELVVGKQSGLSTTQMINNQEYIMVTVPMDMKLGDRQIIALAASYVPDTFNQTLSMTAFDGQAYSCIVSAEGTYIVRPSSEHAIKLGYNVLNSLNDSEIDEGNSMQSLKMDMQADMAGQIGFSLTNPDTKDKTHYYMVYTPVNPDGWYLLTFVPADVVNAKSDSLLGLTLLICGLITLVFAGLITFLFIVFRQNRRKLEKIAYLDSVTEGNTIQRFYELAQEALEAPNRPTYALVYSNLEKFKVLNEQFGRRVCDQILQLFYQIGERGLSGAECMGRLSADNFCFLMRYESEEILLSRFEQIVGGGETYIAENRPAWVLPITEFGVFIIDNDTLPFPQMIDRAKLALRESPRIISSKLRYAIYDDQTRHRLFREKQLEDIMDDALKEREFQVYLQPKYRVKDKCIDGAEALARWASKSEGMIYPDEFIPLFEKNGFVVQLDLFVFEEVCRHLRAWIDDGRKPMKISINCSRVHLKNRNFLLAYRNIVAQYNVPPEYIEIELTESVVMEDSQRLTRVIEEIHEAGFCCSMDDFGSGYSSLNLIQSIAVDTLKLDKIFFRGCNKDSSRMQSVVGSIVTMAKALDMITVAEGVEYPEQVTMLETIGCDYIQGFVFAKPMPIPSFEELAFGEEIVKDKSFLT